MGSHCNAILGDIWNVTFMNNVPYQPVYNFLYAIKNFYELFIFTLKCYIKKNIKNIKNIIKNIDIRRKLWYD